jgi:hypothetical protein
LPNQSRLPLVIGVTGHRDLQPQDREPLGAALRAWFAELRRTLPSTPLVLLSPLAEGADRLVARVFLEAGAGERLLVPLPMQLHEYERDFASGESLKEFRALCAAGQSFEVPSTLFREPLPPEDAPDWRERGYERVGAFIVRYSHLMLALWDGHDTGQRGGTSEVVRFRLEGLPDRLLARGDPLDPPEIGPLYHLPTPRSSARAGTGAPGAPGAPRALYPPAWGSHAEAAESTRRFLEQLETFNRDATAFQAKHPTRVERSRAWLYSGAAGSNAAAPAAAPAGPPLGEAESHILGVYAVADAMALWNQRLAYRMVVFLLVLGVGAVLWNQVYGARADLLAAVGYLSWLLFALLVYYAATRFAWQQKHLDFRSLAEGLRVQFFWRIAGLDVSVADSYLRGHRQELQGVRQSLRFADLLAFASCRLEPPCAVERLRFVQREWIEGQRRYFVGAEGRGGIVDRDQRRLRRASWAMRASIALGALALAVTFLQHQLLPPLLPIPLLLAAATLAFASAAAIAAYSEIMGLAAHVRNGRKMGEFFRRAEERLKPVLEPADDGAPPLSSEAAERVLIDIGREALAENGEWLILHKDRPWELSLG